MAAIDRFNKYKSLADAAASACIRTFLHIVRPTEGFPYHSNFAIQQMWAEWKDANEVFTHMTGMGRACNYVFPTPPPEDAEHMPCRQMWGLLVQQQVESQDFQAPLIKNAVAAILASEACKSHPATCACKVPNNPWTWHECVTELEPLGLKHNPNCQCGGYQRCKQNVTAPVAVAKPEPASMLRQSTYDYQHHVEHCACGTCYKARIDSGTSEAYSRRCQEAARLALDRLCSSVASPTLPTTGTGFGAGLSKAAQAHSTAAANSGGAVDNSDFAKNLFAAMGTPHDST
jgi:hypothetical protein